MSRKRVWIASSLPLVLLAVLAAGVIAHAASPGATIKLGPTGALANPPNSVVVDVTYSCVPSSFSFGQVDVDQSQAGGPASAPRTDVFGFGFFQPVCDDKAHKATVVVTTDFYSPGVFQSGTASASAFVNSGVSFASTQIEMTIR